MTEPIVKGRNLVKRFGSVVGLNHADFDLYPGEVLAVIGDNGAGKSTLIKCFAGAHTPDEGEMWLQGEQVEFRSTHEARERGVETVFQTRRGTRLRRSSKPYLGREERKSGPWKHPAYATRRACVNPQITYRSRNKYSAEHHTGGGELSGGQRQAVS